MDCYCSALASESLLRVTGPDAQAFLQGQTTCDTRLVGAERAVPGAYCTPQGRVVCDFLLSELAPEQFGLRMRGDILAHAAGVLGKYIIFSKAELHSEQEAWQVLALWGEQAGRVVAQVFGACPAEDHGAVRGEGFVVVRSAGDTGFECYVNGDLAADKLGALREASTDAEEEQWRARQVRAGIARIEAATVDSFIPQTVNYDLTGHISFNKGCYTGQEVVARLHYRGKSKRRAYLAQVPTGEDVTAGEPVYTAGSSQACGEVVNVARESEAITLALVSATSDGAENGLHLSGSEGPQLTLLPLPYTIEET